MAEGRLAAAGHAPFSSSLRSPLGLGFASLKSTPSALPYFTVSQICRSRRTRALQEQNTALVDSSQLTEALLGACQVQLGWGYSVVPGCQSPQNLTKQGLKYSSASHVDRDFTQGSVTVPLSLVPA